MLWDAQVAAPPNPPVLERNSKTLGKKMQHSKTELAAFYKLFEC